MKIICQLGGGKMREIIEHGKKSFTIQCNKCGCKFKYDLEDISCGGFLYCPECLQICYHPNQVVKEPSSEISGYTNTPWVFDYKPSTGDPLPDLGVTINYCKDVNECMDPKKELLERFAYLDSKFETNAQMDQEQYHIGYDEAILNYFKSIGLIEVAEKFEKAQSHFWYA